MPTTETYPRGFTRSSRDLGRQPSGETSVKQAPRQPTRANEKAESGQQTSLANSPQMGSVVTAEREVTDLNYVGVHRTPTVFVYGVEPARFGSQPLPKAIVAEIGRTAIAT